MAKGVDWKTVQAKALSQANQKLYREYAEAVAAAGELAKGLKEGAQAEWDKKFPNGTPDGKVAFFNAINGVLMFAMKDKPTGKASVGKTFDAEKGDNPFA